MTHSTENEGGGTKSDENSINLLSIETGLKLIGTD